MPIGHKSSWNTFFLTDYKNITNFLFLGYFEHVCLLPTKTMSTCRNFDVYLHAKNELQPLNPFLIYSKGIANLSTLRMLDYAH